MDEKLQQLIGKYTEVKEYSDELSFMDDFELSSLDIFSLIADIEDTFHITISEDDVRKILTVKDMKNMISSKTGNDIQS